MKYKPFKALRDAVRRRSSDAANEKTITESLRRINIGEYIDGTGRTGIALMVDGIFIKYAIGDSVADLIKDLRGLRCEFISKRWQGGTWPGDLDGDIKRVTTKTKIL